MTIGKYALPIAAALLLIIFFSGLPPLHRCKLPGELPGKRLGKLPGKREDPRRDRRLDWRDAALLLPIMGVYAVLAFWNLGNTASPQSFVPMAGRSAVLELESAQQPAQLLVFPGVGMGSYLVEYSEDGEAYSPVLDFEQGHIEVLKWESLRPETQIVPRFVRIRCETGEPWLGELLLLDGQGERIEADCSIPELCDEPETATEHQSFMNSTYFDEIYHARTAWEHLHGIWPYEISHPPLGKLILSVGVSLLGMTPFGWRFMGTLFGVLMLPVLYVFLKKLFGGRAVPALGTVLLASDFMHYVQTRIATIDTYAVFFILLMYLCMFEYLRRGSLKALALSGLFFGLGAASKWTCIYAGAGLAVLWAMHWLRRAEEEHNPAVFRAYLRNCLFCTGFFVLVPALVYYLSYFPYGQAEGHSLFSLDYARMVLENQSFMLNYHVGVVAEHPYSSRWYQWMLNIRPILYYLEYFDDGKRSSICAFLNPALCWGGLMSLLVLLYTAIFRRDRTAGFILIGYLAQMVPWVFVQRLTFAYHYFPASVFLVLGLCYVFALMRDNCRNWRIYAGAFTLASILLFALFFPALSGLPVDNSRATALMHWLPTWPL